MNDASKEEGEDFDSDWDDEYPEPASIRGKKMSYADKVHTWALRKNLNQLDTIYKQKDADVLKAREELKACRLQIEELKNQRDSVEQEIEEQQKADNIASIFRLRALHKRLCIELGNEEDLESKIALKLKENELDLYQIEVEQGKFASLWEEVHQAEEIMDRQRLHDSDNRFQKEEAFIKQAEKRKMIHERNQARSLMAQELKHRKAIEDAQKNHKKAVNFLKETMSRVRQKEAEEEMKTREEFEKRMLAVLSLKNNITTNRENLQAVQAKNKAKTAVEKEQEKQLFESISTDGGNATKYMLQQKQMQEFDRKKQQFEEYQKHGRMDIITRILQEEAHMSKRKKLQPQLFSGQVKSQDFGQDPSRIRKKVSQQIEKASRELDKCHADVINHRNWRTPSPMSADEEIDSPTQSPLPESTSGTALMRKEDEERESLAEPEFIGLWNQDHKPYKVPKDECAAKPTGASKMEQDILARTLEKHREGIIRKQVAAGREFKGCPFYSKPELIYFKDFDIGKVYKKKVTLINASYGVSFCRLVGVSQHLKDFITVHFDPPGQMSAGMSCEMTVVFKPMINEDLEGEVSLLAQTGPFSVPLKCTTKKCDLAVDKDLIDFGAHVVGETISRIITLTNSGALGTNFQLQTSADGFKEKQRRADLFQFSMITPVSDGAQGTNEKKDHSSLDSKEECQNQGQCPEPENMQTSTLSESPKTKSEENSGNVDISVGSASSALKQSDGDLLQNLEVEEEMEQKLITQTNEQEPEIISEIKPGETTEGEIGPFSSVKLKFIFTPMVPGEVQNDFEIIFTDPNSKPISLKVHGVAIDLPVWVPKPNIDLMICMYDRLYQDGIIIQNRARTALRLKFEVCNELRNHMELLPKTGYIQAQSAFSVQLKFLPRHSLPEDAAQYFDKDTGVLEAPMTIYVADQTRPVHFTVHAVVTTSDLQFDKTEVDFGYCSIYESVQTSIQLTNKSILPQEFGFLGIPEYVDVQPNDGFGTILPMETLNIDLIFKANKAKEYSFDIICKSGINREFKLSCKAIGVHPPLELSHSLIQFAATALYDVSVVTSFVINSHVSQNEFSHPVPRIGKEEIAPVGPTSFEFVVPGNAPLTITPMVGTVNAGQKSKIRVSFRPTLCEEHIKEEAVRIACRAAEAKLMLEKKEKELLAKKAEMEAVSKKEVKSAKGKKKGQSSASPKLAVKEKNAKTNTASCTVDPPKPEQIQPGSDEYSAARVELIRNFRGHFSSYIIPCFVASGETSDQKQPGHLKYSPFNCLYLEVHCPAVAPPLLVISNNGQSTVSFGDVALGQTVMKKITLQNISTEILELRSSLLNPHGPFLLMNALRPLQPADTYTLLISFAPDDSQTFYEKLEIHTVKASLTLSITGRGLTPTLNCSVEGGKLDMGYVLVNESSATTFKIQNTCSLEVKYNIWLDSLSLSKHKAQQALPSFLTPQKEPSHTVGIQNFSGLSVFSVSPIEGIIGPNKSHEINVTFSPDHESLHYMDTLRVQLFDKQVSHVIKLEGAARKHLMFLKGGDPLDVSDESLSSIPLHDNTTTEMETQVKTVLVTLKSKQTEDIFTTAARELQVGCIKTSQSPAKKNVEFFFDNLHPLQQKGFSFDPIKGSVDPGHKRSIHITWTPPAGYDANHIQTTPIQLTLKGDVIEIYKIILSTVVTPE
ncbi:cilia- and flagella-associated protein 74 isoform X1 [Protopterus annectens]|uniref:cilia- and flagella-associated protein 74 isoform X1 n=1 Tax=Protopterus annectens TaxID=7888 RepID=UPI001CFC3E24|nr:cilia- and flagella-associated protein 74 isoform X1 [Protopterus annectens]